LGKTALDPSNSPGHHAKLAADGVGLLCGAQQLCGAPRVEAVLCNNKAKFNKYLPVGSNLPCAGDKLVLTLKENRKKCVWGGKEKKDRFSCQTREAPGSPDRL